MLKEDRDHLLDTLSQVEQLSISAKQLINALKDSDIYNAADQLRGYMKIMKEKLDVALEHVGLDREQSYSDGLRPTSEGGSRACRSEEE